MIVVGTDGGCERFLITSDCNGLYTFTSSTTSGLMAARRFGFCGKSWKGGWSRYKRKRCTRQEVHCKSVTGSSSSGRRLEPLEICRTQNTQLDQQERECGSRVVTKDV